MIWLVRNAILLGVMLQLQITIEDDTIADETFDMLMGNVVAPRRRFIQTHATNVKNLDV